VLYGSGNGTTVIGRWKHNGGQVRYVSRPNGFDDRFRYFRVTRTARPTLRGDETARTRPTSYETVPVAFCERKTNDGDYTTKIEFLESSAAAFVHDAAGRTVFNKSSGTGVYVCSIYFRSRETTENGLGHVGRIMVIERIINVIRRRIALRSCGPPTSISLHPSPPPLPVERNNRPTCSSGPAVN